MRHRNLPSSTLPANAFKSLITQFPCSHFDGKLMLPRVRFSLKMFNRQRHKKAFTQITHKRFIPVGLRPSQMEIAMHRMQGIPQLPEHTEQRHRISPATQCHNYRHISR